MRGISSRLELFGVLHHSSVNWNLRVDRGRGTFILFNALVFYFGLVHDRCDYGDYAQEYVYPVLQQIISLAPDHSLSRLIIKPPHPIVFMGSTKGCPLAEAEWIPYIIVLNHLFHRRAWFLFMSWPIFFLTFRLKHRCKNDTH